MFDKKDGKVVFIFYPADDIGQLVHLLRVHPGGWLIQKEYPGVGSQGPGHLQSSLVPVRQVSCRGMMTVLKTKGRKEVHGPFGKGGIFLELAPAPQQGR